MTAAELPAAVLKGRLGARLVVTRHFASARGRSMPRRLAAVAIRRRIDEQIAISRFVADSIGEPSTVLHNGVLSSDRLEPRENAVLVLQRLQREKDTETAVRAWAVSGLGREGWRLLIHGRGAEERALRLLAADLGVGTSVEFGGFTDEPRVALASAAMLLATASAEPFGLAVVESMAEATPVIAADSGAHRETLGGDGRYFVPGDVDGCASVLRELASDPATRAQLGEALRIRQRVEFSVAHHVDRLEQIYAGTA
jgi:glycosyltransferase involved in cell wall biosynthesis